MAEEIILEIKGIKKYFPIRGGLFRKVCGYIKAVDGLDLAIRGGETLGLVGESGCGKSTLAKTILRLYEPDEGIILFEDKDITKIEMREMRKDMQIVFQDPYSSLDPRFKIREIILEAINAFDQKRKFTKKEKEARLREIIEEVRLPLDSLSRFPHEFSGGERQRIAIARSLVSFPKFLILDEPVSALDVLIQLEILNLLERLKEEFHLTYLFISHNLKVIQKVSDRICVMYLGKIVEICSKEEIFKRALHPYTFILLSSVERKKFLWKEEIPLASQIPSGCRFHPRCPYTRDICREIEPELEEKVPSHLVSCHYPLSYV
jgi:oligopeptide/dipeptide ABC transporter ATP-binding protein